MVAATLRASESTWQVSRAISDELGRNHGLALRHLLCGVGELVASPGVTVPRVVQRLAADHLAVADQRDEELTVVAVVPRRLSEPHHLRLGDTGRRQPPHGPLATADRDLVRALLRHGDHLAVVALTRHQLVDEAAGRVPRPDDELGADAVPVHR